MNDQASNDDVNREKRQQVQKLENDVKDMEGKLTRADKSVWKTHEEKNISLEFLFRFLQIKNQHELFEIKLNH